LSGIELGPDITACLDKEVILALPNGSVEGEIYWSNGSSGNSITVHQEGTYSVRVVQGNCVLTDSIRVKFIPPLAAEDTEYITFCQGESRRIGIVAPGAGYRWNTGETSAFIDVDKAGTYILTIGNVCGEVANIFEVHVDHTCCAISAPNIFTPNHDNKNELFQIFVGERITDASLQIVNRWGSKVYEADDLSRYWDGMHNGVEAPAGVYFWTINSACEINQQLIRKTFKGTITLQR
jgi:gliding motility-associated-like protein